MSYLDLDQIVRSGPGSASLSAKQTALAGWLAEILALHATDGLPWTVATHPDPRLALPGLDGATVEAVMGRPARYAEVLWRSREGAGTGSSGYDPTAPALVFDVGLYYGSAADRASVTYAADVAADYAAFLSVVYAADDGTGPGAGPPGVLYAAERHGEITTPGGSVVALSPPSSVTAGRVPGDGRARPDLFALSFTVTLS